MRVLLTADTIGGVWTYAMELARGLGPRGIQFALVTMGAPLAPSQRAQIGALDNVTLFESDFKLEWMDEPWEDVRRSGQWLLEIEQQFKPDIVHLNGYAHGSVPFIAPRLVVAHSCVLSWWQACRGEPAPPRWNQYREEVRRGLSAADMVVAPTGAMLAQLQRHYGRLENARVIPNGRSAEQLCPRLKETFVLSVGRLWDEAKNLGAVDSIAARLPWPVHVAGDDRHPNGSRATTHAVVLLGKLDEAALADLYSRAAIYVLPARYEPFGLSVLEAAMSGCALILGEIPSLRENWDGAAEFVAPDGRQQLLHAIQRLIDDPPRRADGARRARQRAGRFTLTAFANAYLNVYKKLAKRSVSPHPTRSICACAS